MYLNVFFIILFNRFFILRMIFYTCNSMLLIICGECFLIFFQPKAVGLKAFDGFDVFKSLLFLIWIILNL